MPNVTCSSLLLTDFSWLLSCYLWLLTPCFLLLNHYYWLVLVTSGYFWLLLVTSGSSFYEQRTVFSPINGHSKRRTPLISGQFFFHQPNSGQSLIKNFLKGGQVTSGRFKIFRNQNRKINKIERFSKHLETLHSSSFFTASIFLINQFTSFSWP